MQKDLRHSYNEEFRKKSLLSLVSIIYRIINYAN